MTQTVPPLSTAEESTAARPRSSGRWPLTGVVAGALGFGATLITDIHPAAGDGPEGPEVVERLSQGMAHASVVTGYLAVAALLVLAAQWRRFVEPRVLNSTAARVVSGGLTAAAGALALGYGWKGAMAVYLEGGMDDKLFGDQGLFVYYMLNDFGSFIGWLGVVIAAGGVAWMAFRERTVSRWIGAVSLVPVLAATGITALTGLPGFPGVVAPLWMIIAFAGLAFGRSTIAR